MRVVIIGGGYAGLAAAIELRHRLADMELHIVDPRKQHIKITQLHRTLHRPLSEYSIPFADLQKRFTIIHHRTALEFTESDLIQWQRNKTIVLPNRSLSFDYLIIATGAKPYPLPRGRYVYTQDDFCHQEGSEIIQAFLARTAQGERYISVVGAGATGVQFIFELDYALKSQPIDYQLRLIDKANKLLPDLPAGFHKYISSQLKEAGIEYIPDTQYKGQKGGKIHLQNLQTGHSYALPSGLTLLFPGVIPTPCRLQTNRYGNVRVGRQILPTIFAAGDCSRFASRGLNALTAQAAVRKGKQVAVNIQRILEKRLPYIYAYGERGYFISLGPLDGIGWTFLKRAIVTGLAAFAVREAIETQYNLFVDGLDLYV